MAKSMLGVVLCVVFIGSVDTVAAQQIIGTYQTTIGERDHFNSSGQKLRDFCAIIQQDRANFHRFSLRDTLDEFDPFFTTMNSRAIISGNCKAGGLNAPYLRENVLSQWPHTVFVEVYGKEGRITGVIVYDVGG